MLTAYYCFVNLGWPPSKFDNLPYNEKIMVMAFAMREMKTRKEEEEKIKQKG